MRLILRVLLLLTAFCITVSCSEKGSDTAVNSDAETPQRKKIMVKLKNDLWDFNHGREILTIKSIEEFPGDEIGIKMVIQPHIAEFSHFLISVDGSKFQRSPDSSIVADFILDDDSAQKASFIVKLISHAGKHSEPFSIDLICNAKKYWESRGAKGYPNWITVKTYPFINFTPAYSIENWIYKKPTSDERKYAETKWGNLIKYADSDYEKAKLLGKTLLNDLKPHVGVPSDSMKIPPFEQYERMISGKDKGFCTNFAHILIYACNSLGIPARRIHLEKVHSRSDKCSIRMGGMHSTIEIFDEQLDQWVWIDINSNALGAYLGQEGPLSMVEFCLFLNQKERRKNLRLLIYDYKEKTEKLLPLSECPNKYASFDGWDTEFHYFYSAIN